MDHSVLQREFINDHAHLVDKYAKRIDVVEQTAKSNARMSFDDHKKVSLAIWLDNVDKELKRYKRLKGLSDRTYSETVGPFKRHAYNIISALYTSADLGNIISIQPLTQKRGAIYYMYTKYGSDKGTVQSGDNIFSPKDGGVRNGYYSSPHVKGETVAFTYDGSADSTAALKYYPLSQPTFISLVITGGAAAGTWTYLSTSGSNYNLQLNASGTADGTININTGVVTLTGLDIGAGTAAINYYWNSEKYSTSVPIPRVTVGVEEKEVRAERRQLLVELMLDVSHDFESQFAQSLDAAMNSNVIQMLQNEITFRVMEELYSGADGNQGTTYTFYKTPPSGVSKIDHAATLAEKLGEMSTKIRDNLGRGGGNVIITGNGFTEYVDILGDGSWKPAPIPSGNGPMYAGKLFSKYDVYYNPEYTSGQFVMTHKGNDWWTAPYYMGTYLPLMNSQFLLYPDMHGEQGYIAMEAYEYEFPKSVVIGTMDPSAAP